MGGLAVGRQLFNDQGRSIAYTKAACDIVAAEFKSVTSRAEMSLRSDPKCNRKWAVLAY